MKKNDLLIDSIIDQVIDPALTAFDFDGVVADTMNLFLDIARHDFGITGLKYEDFTEYMIEECLNIPPDILDEIFDMINNGSYSHTLRQMPGAVDVLCRFGSFSSPLLVVTARPDSGVVKEWFAKNLGSCLDKWEIVATGTFEGKKDVLLEKGIRYFVEDRLETCFQIEKAGIVPILYTQPWNRKEHFFIEAGSWSEIKNLAGL
ncbi:5' nucleotidase, NT5C type [Desulforegula conservatrix]|uniref:5' nucleotidase, NT5C type n=1 Tax=Desulforegula conservatrix TaxID=153026 RepID=UPI0003FF44BB|nr:haloacid dehalogenase [Desulforegula conservatrix]